MDFTWTPYFNAFWVFPLLCLIFMAIMMFRRGCTPFRGGHRTQDGDGGESARRILDRRYASGQIGKQQYDAIRRDLNE